MHETWCVCFKGVGFVVGPICFRVFFWGGFGCCFLGGMCVFIYLLLLLFFNI